MVAAHIEHALATKLRHKGVAVAQQVDERLVDALLVGLHVDDGAQGALAQQLVVLGLAAAHGDEAARHGLEGIHGRGVGVELVEYDFGVLHHFHITGEGHRLGTRYLYLVGEVAFKALYGAQHDVRTLVDGAGALHSYKYAQWGAGLPGEVGLFAAADNGEGNEMQLAGAGAMGLVTDIILIKPCHNGIGVVHYVVAPEALGAVQPVALELVVVGGVALVLPHIEVAVTKGFEVEASLDIIVVHAECAQHHPLVVLPEVAIKPRVALGLEVEKDGVDELHHVVAAEALPRGPHLEIIIQSMPHGLAGPAQVNVTRVGLPTIAVGSHRHFVS